MKIKQLIFFTFFLLSSLCVSAQEITVQSLAQRKSAIEHQVRTDLSTELENIEDLSVIGVPFCWIAIKGNKITLTVDDSIFAQAVIRSGEKTIDYAMSYIKDSFILRSTEPPDTVIRMGRNIPPLVEKALKYTSSPFYIFTTYFLFTGFGFYENGSLKYIGFSNSEPVLFSNIEDFVKYRLGKKYKKYLKNKNH